MSSELATRPRTDRLFLSWPPSCNQTGVQQLYSVVKKMSPLFILLQFLHKWTDFNNIWHTVYWVNSQHKSYWLTHPTYIQLLCYFRKTRQMHKITLATTVTHYSCTYKIYSAYLHSQSTLNVYVYSNCSNYLIFHPHRPEVPYTIHQ